MPMTDSNSVSKKLRRRIMPKRKVEYEVIDKMYEHGIDYWRAECKRLQKQVIHDNNYWQIKFDDDTERIKRLQKEIDNWHYEMAYWTDEKIPTPRGTAKFIMKNVFDKRIKGKN